MCAAFWPAGEERQVGGACLHSSRWALIKLWEEALFCPGPVAASSWEHKDILLTCPTQFSPTFEGLAVRHKGGCFWYPVLRPLKKSQKARCWWERLCQGDLPKDPSGGKACILGGSRKDGGAQHTWGGVFRVSYLAFLCEIIGKDLDAGKD